MKFRFSALFASLLLMMPCGLAARTPDSLAVHSAVSVPDSRSGKSFALELVTPLAVLGTGTVIHFAAHDAVDVPLAAECEKWRGGREEIGVDSYLRFLPFAMSLGLEYLGAAADSPILDRAIELSLTTVSLVAVAQTLKICIDSPRPNGEDNKSFPSGHSTIAFAGAELVRLEYGPAWGAAAYALATGVAVMRLYNGAHYLSDVIAGAGVGILCARVGHYLTGPVKKLLGIDVKVAPTVDPVSGNLCATLALSF